MIGPLNGSCQEGGTGLELLPLPSLSGLGGAPLAYAVS